MSQAGMSPEQLAAEAAIELPERELLQAISPTAPVVGSELAAVGIINVGVGFNVLSSDSTATAEASVQLDLAQTR